jgi:GLPGLI family protein
MAGKCQQEVAYIYEVYHDIDSSKVIPANKKPSFYIMLMVYNDSIAITKRAYRYKSLFKKMINIKAEEDYSIVMKMKGTQYHYHFYTNYYNELIASKDYDSDFSDWSFKKDTSYYMGLQLFKASNDCNYEVWYTKDLSCFSGVHPFMDNKLPGLIVKIYDDHHKALIILKEKKEICPEIKLGKYTLISE